MRCKKEHLLLALFLMVLAALIGACKSATPASTSTLPGITVGITDGICPNVTVQTGDQVTWINNGKEDHIVRDATSGSESQFDSGTLGPGNSFSFIFTEAKSYTYLCSADGKMTGTVTVKPKG